MSKSSFWHLGHFLVWLVISTCSVAKSAESLPDLIDSVTQSVVGVGTAYPPRTPTGGQPPRRLMGTGFVIQSDTRSLIVTNAHVVTEELDSNGGERLAIFIGTGRTAEQRYAFLLKQDPVHDLAVLSYEGLPLPAMELARPDSVRPGERIAFTGFPIGAVLGLYPATHEGIVSAITPIARPADSDKQLSAIQLRRLRDSFNVIQLDAIAYPGNSGSAVFRINDGRVIGVINSTFVKESRESLLSSPSGIAFAIPVEHLIKLIEGL